MGTLIGKKVKRRYGNDPKIGTIIAEKAADIPLWESGWCQVKWSDGSTSGWLPTTDLTPEEPPA
jgi:hypothetical protein